MPGAGRNEKLLWSVLSDLDKLRFGRCSGTLGRVKLLRQKLKKALDLQIYSRIVKKNEKVTVNSKYYREHQRILMFIYLMASRFLYLLVDWETFNTFVRTSQRCNQNPSNIHDFYLKTLNILVKRLILDTWLGSESANADEYITVLKIQTEIWQDGRRVRTESF